MQSSEKLKLWLTGDQSQVCVLEGNSGCGPVGITKCDLRGSEGVVLLWLEISGCCPVGSCRCGPGGDQWVCSRGDH